jgi:transcriptional regulator with XRE-family HTH domain
MKPFQKKLIKLRKSAGYETAKDFATACKIPYQNYMNYENKGSEPKYEILCRIAENLNVSVDELLDHKTNDKYTSLISSLARCKIKTDLTPENVTIYYNNSPYIISYKIFDFINASFIDKYNKGYQDTLKSIDTYVMGLMHGLFDFGNEAFFNKFLDETTSLDNNGTTESRQAFKDLLIMLYKNKDDKDFLTFAINKLKNKKLHENQVKVPSSQPPNKK